MRKLLNLPIWALVIFAFFASWALLTDLILECSGFIFLPFQSFLESIATPLRWIVIVPWYTVAAYLGFLGTVRLMDVAIAVGEETYPSANPANL